MRTLGFTLASLAALFFVLTGAAHAQCELVAAEIPVIVTDPSLPTGGVGAARNGLIVANFRLDGSVVLPDATGARVRIVPERSSGLRAITLPIVSLSERDRVIYVEAFQLTPGGTRIAEIVSGRNQVQVAEFNELPSAYLGVQATARVTVAGALRDSCRSATKRGPFPPPVHVEHDLRRLAFPRPASIKPFVGLLSYLPISRE